VRSTYELQYFWAAFMSDKTRGSGIRVVRAGIYFILAMILEGLLLLTHSPALAMIFLFPGMIVSGLISSGSNTSNFSFLFGLVVDAALYSYLALFLESKVRRIHS
jgi:hypothetical protein